MLKRLLLQLVLVTQTRNRKDSRSSVWVGYIILLLTYIHISLPFVAGLECLLYLLSKENIRKNITTSVVLFTFYHLVNRVNKMHRKKGHVHVEDGIALSILLQLNFNEASSFCTSQSSQMLLCTLHPLPQPSAELSSLSCAFYKKTYEKILRLLWSKLMPTCFAWFKWSLEIGLISYLHSICVNCSNPSLELILWYSFALYDLMMFQRSQNARKDLNILS